MAIYEWEYKGEKIKTPYEIVWCKNETHLCFDPYEHPVTHCGLNHRKNILTKVDEQKITCLKCLKNKASKEINDKFIKE
jgi:hypothetical protein